MYDVENFTGKQMFAESEIYSEKIENAVNAYQNLYDEYDYIDKTVASIPQKKSIPQYVKTSRSLVNAMGKAFYNTTMSLYDETVELNLEIDDLNEEIEQRNQKKCRATQNQILKEQDKKAQAGLNLCLQSRQKPKAGLKKHGDKAPFSFCRKLNIYHEP